MRIECQPSSSHYFLRSQHLNLTMKLLPTISATLLLSLFPALAADEPAKAAKKAAETEAKKQG